MPGDSVNRLVARLEQWRDRFGSGEVRRLEKLLDSCARHQFTDLSSLIRFHETLLFLRAFPQSPGVVARAEKLLNSFHRRIEALQSRDVDLAPLDTFELSGIAGTTMEDTLSFDVLRWLVRHIPRNVEILWDQYEEERAMAATWPRFFPLLEEDAYVEANIPWRRWLSTASGGSRPLPWLIRQFERSPYSPREKTELYDSLRLPVSWKLENLKISRTRNWAHPPAIHYHRTPLTVRGEVDLQTELARPSPVLKRLSLVQGRVVMDRIREVMLVRYRELYGTTLGDPRSVVRANVGRGVVIHLWSLPPDRRLPLRAYLAGFTLKNGVPINYIEAIGLCEWIEVGFNTFYTFRKGETAWIYAQALRCLCAHTRAKCISVYPYQLGQNNDEALESGAFWFYRKLGFRSGLPELRSLTEREEQRIRKNRCYKSPLRVLKQLAQGHMFYELPGSDRGAWDRFSVRNLGLRVNRKMAEQFGGDGTRFRKVCAMTVSRALGWRSANTSSEEERAFEDWALVLSQIPGLAGWTRQDKSDLVKMIRAKAGTSERYYLRLTQHHARLRRELLRLGSSL